MIKAYLVWMSTGYEGEDVEIRYSIYRDEEMLERESMFVDYKKPALAGQFAIKILLENLEDYKDEKINIIIHDGALFEILNGTSTSKNREVQNMGEETREELGKFENIEVEDVTGNHIDIENWNNILKF